jgi:hypothetical protein
MIRRLSHRTEHLGDDCHGRLAGDRAFDWLGKQQCSQSYQCDSVQSSEISDNRAFVIRGCRGDPGSMSRFDIAGVGATHMPLFAIRRIG